MEADRLSDLIDTAIRREEEAFHFYTELNEKIEDKSVKDTLFWIANEEKKHKQFLIDYRDGRYEKGMPPARDVKYYKIAENQNEPEIQKDMKSEEVFLVAAHREHRSHKFYLKLSDMHTDGKAKEMLRRMASEELKHKEKMEYLYANTAFPQTAGG